MPLPTNPDGTGVTGAGKYKSAETQAVYKWKCPTCGAQLTTPLEQGCPACAERIRHEAKGKRPEEVGVEELLTAVLRHPNATHAPRSIRAEGLTLVARRTIFRALAYAAETSPALFVQDARRQDNLLEKHVALAWARLLNQADEAETPKTPPPAATD